MKKSYSIRYSWVCENIISSYKGRVAVKKRAINKLCHSTNNATLPITGPLPSFATDIDKKTSVTLIALSSQRKGDLQPLVFNSPISPFPAAAKWSGNASCKSARGNEKEIFFGIEMRRLTGLLTYFLFHKRKRKFGKS